MSLFKTGKIVTLIKGLYHCMFKIQGSKGRAAVHDIAFINCQYSMATFSTGERKQRPRGDRKSQEMTHHLKQTFDGAILTHLYPHSQIDIYVEVRRSGVTIFVFLCGT